MTLRLLSGVAAAALMIIVALMLLWPAHTFAAGDCSRPLVLASEYGKETCGGRPPGTGPGTCHTAAGIPFDGTQWLIANKALPIGTKVRFTYRGRSVVAPVGDRGPYVRGRVFDLSHAVAQALGLSGVQRVCAEVVP